jgi:hypothetical protein
MANRSEIWTAVVTKRPTLIPDSVWISASAETHAEHLVQDHYCNLATSNFARIANVLRSLPIESQSSDIAISREIQELWDDLQGWGAARPPCVRPILELEETDDNPFPVILFSNSSASE